MSVKATRTRLPGLPDVFIRDAKASDADAVLRLVAAANPDDPGAFEGARPGLENLSEGPLSRTASLVILAEDGTGTPLGALMGGVPSWLLKHPGVSHPILFECLIARIGIISAVAVRPDRRGGGVGSALVRHAVSRFTRAGYGLLTLNFTPSLEGYYQRLKFATMDNLIVHIGDGVMLGQRWDDTRVAAKTLDQRTELTAVQGLDSPLVSGILPHTRVPKGTYFDGERLRR
ncbi:hypothetical protein CTZ27_31220 [Streptomyces griseocarneus]|nr:hypothetical protein CTZ27_31220 [Streptomyces griseocarneus]